MSFALSLRGFLAYKGMPAGGLHVHTKKTIFGAGKKKFGILLMTAVLGLTACSQSEAAEMETAEAEMTIVTQANGSEAETAGMRIRITVGDTELTATLEDNATTRAWMEEMPMKLSMSDLYGREMCYRYGAGTFPTENLRSDGYEVGDIAYWPPMGSLVILYEQNGEQFQRQHIGHIDSGIEIFERTGDAEVSFEVIE